MVAFILVVIELAQATLLDFKLILIQSEFKTAHIYKQKNPIVFDTHILECASS